MFGDDVMELVSVGIVIVLVEKDNGNVSVVR